MIKVIASPLVALGLGSALTCLLWPRRRRLLADLPLIISLSVGLGFGISSLLFFVWLVVHGPGGSAFAGCEIGLLLVLSVLAIAGRRRNPPAAKPPTHGPFLPKSKIEWIITATFFFALVAATGGFTWLTRAALSGGWDAWGIWNLRAKFLFLGAEHWSDAFSSAGSLSHTDYPLLIPLSVARGWSYAGSDVPLVPIVIGALFTAATAGLLLSSLSVLRSRSQGLLAATVLLATPYFLVLGSAQYADVPLSFFYLSTLVLLCLQESMAAAGGMLALAGASAAFAAWTKNEGTLFLVCLLFAYLTVMARREKTSSSRMRELALVAAGLAPALAVLFYFKLKFASHNDLFPSVTTALKMLGRISRWRVVVKAFAYQWLHFGGWAISLTPFLACYPLFVGIDERRSGAWPKLCLRALCFTALGYFLIYIITLLPLAWLLETSLNRVLAQLWPSALFLLFLTTKAADAGE